MKFIRDLLGKKRSETNPRRASSVESLEQSYRETIGSMVDEAAPLGKPAVATPIHTDTRADVRVVTAEQAPAAPAVPSAPAAPAAVNIWDLEDDGTSTALPEPTAPIAPARPVIAPVAEQAVASAAAARSPARSRRTKTRLIGFDKSDGDVVDLFNDAQKAAPTKSVRFPVGWIVVAEGPGRGESFSLMAGMSQIGRGEDQAIQLDFGDNSISRSNHAAIVYDPDTKEFLLGHGGKSNIVRLNDKPLISNETLKTGDVIRIGETVLRFVALCDKSFNWSDGATEEDEDVAIA
ncbi:FHA domain-containing protein [Yoonia sp.]|uniref:FHA domain-containing protein n=1 Tax=Yoonia sp. TaxID=2212373 RepID=UPI002E0CCD53|nr:FHA domain-containing protein [Yoonia sp.]